MQQAPPSVPPPAASDNPRAYESPSEHGEPAPEKRLPRRAGLFSRARMLGPVTKEYGDWPLLAMSLVTGIVDGACFTNYGMFVGMQTGKPQ